LEHSHTSLPFLLPATDLNIPSLFKGLLPGYAGTAIGRWGMSSCLGMTSGSAQIVLLIALSSQKAEFSRADQEKGRAGEEQRTGQVIVVVAMS